MGSHKSRLLHLPTRILKGYIETLPGFGHKYHPDGLNSRLLSSLHPWKWLPTVGTVDRMYIPRTESGWGASDSSGPVLRTRRSCPLNYLFQQLFKPPVCLFSPSDRSLGCFNKLFIAKINYWLNIYILNTAILLG